MLNLNEKYFTISEPRGRNHQNKFCLRPLKRRFSPWELNHRYAMFCVHLVSLKWFLVTSIQYTSEQTSLGVNAGNDKLERPFRLNLLIFRSGSEKQF